MQVHSFLTMNLIKTLKRIDFSLQLSLAKVGQKSLLPIFCFCIKERKSFRVVRMKRKERLLHEVEVRSYNIY